MDPSSWIIVHGSIILSGISTLRAAGTENLIKGHAFDDSMKKIASPAFYLGLQE
jgi:hypothetical protein